MSTEKKIENEILEYLNKSGIFAWKNQTTGIYDPVRKTFRKSFNKFHIKGVADIIGILPNGKFLAIEAKTPKTKNRATEYQKDFLMKIAENGGLALIATSAIEVANAIRDFINSEN